MTHRLTRKLAVILHADVVGSSRLVHLDETLAHERIRDTFQRFTDTIRLYNGIAHEIRGDALVAEFPRASDAVSASLFFQAANARYVDGLHDEIRPVLRIGLAMGEVVVADHTVTGDGVVLAQRLEQTARPGGIAIQGAVHEAVPKRLPFDYEDLGELELKGFDETVRALAARLKDGATVPDPDPQADPEANSLLVPDRNAADAGQGRPLAASQSRRQLLLGGGAIALILLARIWLAMEIFRFSKRENMATTLLMSTGLPFGTISALFGFTNGIIDQEQYTMLVTAVILSAVVPTVIAQKWFQPEMKDLNRDG